MPTRKQRRRREKGRRHEYEYVMVDDEGREVEVLDEAPERPQSRGGARTKQAPAKNARGRTIQPPSWRRVGKRGLIFAPLMFVTVSLLSSNLTVPQRIAQTFFLLVVFLPFSYVMDSMTYRMWRRRTAEDGRS